MQTPSVTHFFDEATNTFSYVVQDPDSQACAIIDSVLDFDYAAGRIDVRSADQIISFIRDNNLQVEWILETHVHADHLSAAPYLHEHLGGKTGIGAKIVDVQEIFGKASTPAPNLPGTVASLTSCLRRATPSGLATWRGGRSFTRLVTRRHA